MVKRAQSTHLGMEGCLLHARDLLFWPNVSAKIKDYIARFETCSSNPVKRQKETLAYGQYTGSCGTKDGSDIFTPESD